MLSTAVWLLLVSHALAETAVTGCQPFEVFGSRWAAAPVAGAHALVGKAFDARSGEMLPWHEIPARLAAEIRSSSPLVLLGEVHDNPDHHALRAGVIALAACVTGERTSVVMEHIRSDQQDVLDALFRIPAQPRTSAELFRALDWSKSGWPDAKLFAPMLDAVLETHLAIVPGEPSRSRVRSLARGETDAVPAEERSRLGLDRAMPQPLLDALAAELKDSHCGALPERAIAGLSAAQRYRDAYQADALVTAATRHGGAILLAGNGHVRADRGVPWHIRQRKPGQPTLTAMFLEVEAGRVDPRSYLPRDPDGQPAADVLVFTRRAERPDPCEAMRRNIEKKG